MKKVKKSQMNNAQRKTHTRFLDKSTYVTRSLGLNTIDLKILFCEMVS